jgi:TPR repeat protein
VHDDPSTDAMTEALLVVAQSGNAEAMYRLGSLAKLSGDAPGPAEAGSWWRRAAVAGRVEAIYRLGLFMEDHDEEMRRLLDADEASEQGPEADPRTWQP